MPLRYAFFILLLFPSAALAQVGGFSARPATFDPKDPATRAYFKQTLRPGSTFRGSIIVQNSLNRVNPLRVYGVDGLTGTTSGAVYANRTDTPKEAGKWIRFTRSRLTLQPKAEVRLDFTVRIPRNTRAGDHLAGLAVENAKPSTAKGRSAVKEILRTVVGFQVIVPGPAKPALKISAVRPVNLPGTTVPSVVITMKNSGKKLCQPQLAVTVTRSGKLSKKQKANKRTKQQRKLDTLLPGDQIMYPFPWPKTFPKGSYKIIVKASGCGKAPTFTRTVKLKKSLATKRLTGEKVTNRSTPYLIAGGIGLLLLLLGGIAGLQAMNRRKIASMLHQHNQANPSSHTPQPSDPNPAEKPSPDVGKE